MLGYVTLTPEGLSREQQQRYQAYYCGLCRNLGQRFGPAGRMILSNDMTFLCLLLSSLYEPQERAAQGRCLPHPIQKRGFVQNECSDYCGDMCIALAYHKCLDDWKDDHSLAGRAEAGLLQKAYVQVRKRHPMICQRIEQTLENITQMEKEGRIAPDEGAEWTAQMLGTIFRYREDHWSTVLQMMGEALGRFIYLMDAYDDLQADMRRHRYNPLMEYAKQEGYEALCRDTLTLMMAECTQAFELLPLVQDVDILRNILYAGVWARYQQKQAQQQKKPKKAQPERKEGQG